MARSKEIFIHRNVSKARQAARKVGIIIKTPQPSLPFSEQEETDIM